MKLRVSVGASTDASWNAVFRNIVDSASRAQRKISGDEQSAMRMHEQLLKSKLRSQETILKSQIAAEKSVHDQLNALEMTRLRSSLQRAQKAAKDKAKAELSEVEKVEKEKLRIISQAERKTANITARRQLGESDIGGGGGGGGGGRNMGYRMGYWASRNFSPVTPMLSYAGRMAGNVARGAGIDLDVGSMVGNRVKNETLATDITNSAYLPGGAGASGQRQDPTVLMKETKKAADDVALSQQTALEGLKEFVAKTGDLETGRNILADMGKLSRATGTNFNDMVSASGDVALALGDTDNKAEKVKSVMKAIAGQGKLGAIEIRDLSTQMAKLSSRAGEFHGDVGENIGMLGAMAQMARAHGGAKSASQATTSVGAFLDVFSKGKRVADYQALTGHSYLNKEGKMENPQEMIMEILRASKGDSLKIAKVMGSTQATRTIRGYTSFYNNAGGGQKGLEAVAAEFDRLKRAAMSDKEIEESFGRSMLTAEARVQIFQNKLQDTADKMADKILPALEKLAPTAITLVESFGTVATWLAENPFAIIPAALTASIAKSGAEQAIRAGIENIFNGKAAGASTSVGGKVGNVAASAFVIAAAAITITQVGMMAIDHVMEEKKKKQDEAFGAEFAGVNAASALALETKQGRVSPETIARAKKAADEMQAKALKLAEGPGLVEQWMRGATVLSGNGDVVAKDDKTRNETAKKMLEESLALRRLIATGTLKVVVTNPPSTLTPPAASPGSNTAAPVDN